MLTHYRAARARRAGAGRRGGERAKEENDDDRSGSGCARTKANLA
jgi:hypothetical protein